MPNIRLQPTALPPVRRLSLSVMQRRGMDWMVETASGFGLCAALDVSVTVIGPVAQDEGLGGGSRPTTATTARGGLLPTHTGQPLGRAECPLSSGEPTLATNRRHRRQGRNRNPRASHAGSGWQCTAATRSRSGSVGMVTSAQASPKVAERRVDPQKLGKIPCGWP